LFIRGLSIIVYKHYDLLTFSLDAERGGRHAGEKKAGPLHLVLDPSGVFGVSFTYLV